MAGEGCWRRVDGCGARREGGEGEGCVQVTRKSYFVWSVYPAPADQYSWRSGGGLGGAAAAARALLHSLRARVCEMLSNRADAGSMSRLA
ncbi:unnamed protein product, partial [Iphiclides podalirius]